MMYCQHCGKELQDGAAVCTGCGFAVTPGAVTDSPAALKDGKSAKIFGILALLLFSPLGIAALVLANRSKEANNGVYCKDAKTGLTCGIIALCFWGICILWFILNNL